MQYKAGLGLEKFKSLSISDLQFQFWKEKK
jgi:hypothetical protein